MTIGGLELVIILALAVVVGVFIGTKVTDSWIFSKEENN